MKRMLGLPLLLSALLVLGSCGSEKTAATAAIQSAVSAWTAVKDNVAKIMPDEAKSMDGAIAAAQASLEQGDAKAALAAAKDLPARIQQLSEGLATKEGELRGVWEAMSAGLPGVVATIQRRVDILSKVKSLPAGIDRAAFDGAKSSLAQATQMWSEAQSEQKSGNLASAVSKAMGVKDLVVKILTALNMPVPEALRT
jgi:hypothetical protein